MKLNKFQLIDAVVEAGFLPLFTHDDPEVAFDVIKACHDGGVRIFEYTNRAVNSEEIFEYLVSRKDELPGMILGIGTVMDADQCSKYIELGAEFVLSPILDSEVAQICQSHQVGWIPGCGTVTEMVQAQRLGAAIVKLFPANVLGPGFIKASMAPCPDLHILPTGGVKPERENLEKWFGAGAVAVGMGSQLFQYDFSKSESFAALTEEVHQLHLLIKEIRNG